MADHLSDQEQLQLIKDWWKENGRFLIICIGVAASAYFGWNWWTTSQRQHAEQASELYSELVSSIETTGIATLSDDALTTASFLVEQLKNDYGDTVYAVNAALISAKLAVDKGDLDAAASELRFSIEKGKEDLQTIAKHRLARVYLAQKNFDEALTLASYNADDAFASKFADLRGDIYVAKGEYSSAIAAYQEALEKIANDDNIRRGLIEIKLADLSASGE